MASYKIEFKKSALKDLKRLKKSFIPHVFDKIEALSANPHPQQSLKLRSSESSYRLRIGDYRVLYQIDDSAKIIYIFGIGHRKEIYRSL